MTWSDDFANLAVGVSALVSVLFVVGFALVIVTLVKRRARSSSGGGFFEGVFLSRRARVERRYLVLRGPHYPRKTVTAKVRWFLPARILRRSRWGR